MRYTRLAALVDPDPKKEMSLDALKILVDNADIIMHGGTPNEDLVEDEEVHTQKSIARIRSLRNGETPPIYIFPGSPRQVVPGADYVLYLFVPNSTDPFFSWRIQILSIDDVLKRYGMERLKPMMYLPKGGKAGEYAKIDRSWKRPDYLKAAKIANMLGFHSLYLEGGSGGEPFDKKVVEEVSEILDLEKMLFVGGGYTSVSKIEEVVGIADVIVVGTELEKNPNFAKDVRKILNRQEA